MKAQEGPSRACMCERTARPRAAAWMTTAAEAVGSEGVFSVPARMVVTASGLARRFAVPPTWCRSLWKVVSERKLSTAW